MIVSHREREERKNDPNVEYVDVEDYRPGGKYGPPISTPAQVQAPSAAAAASDVAASAEAAERLEAAHVVRAAAEEVMKSLARRVLFVLI